MTIIVTGGAGFLGQRLIAGLLEARQRGLPGLAQFDRIVSLDIAPARIFDPSVTSVVGDVCEGAFITQNIGDNVSAIYHLAAVVSGQAESDFDLGMRVNLDGLRLLLDRARGLARPPRFVFASSLAVFGGTLPACVGDDQPLAPSSSYGAQKAIGELLVADYSRKGYVNGVALRLPTVVVRPGKPNAAASSFASSIIREPLAGLEAICPVPLQTRLWLSSPNMVAANLVHALTLPADPRQKAPAAINLPGISVTVSQMLDSLERIGGPERRSLVRMEPDQNVAAIVCSWPGDFDVSRALSMGFCRDEGFDQVVRQYARETAPAGIVPA